MGIIAKWDEREHRTGTRDDDVIGVEAGFDGTFANGGAGDDMISLFYSLTTDSGEGDDLIANISGEEGVVDAGGGNDTVLLGDNDGLTDIALGEGVNAIQIPELSTLMTWKW